MIRRKLFVPGPGVWSPENFDSGLPDRCLELGGKPRHAKDEEEAVLFAEGRKALLPLPSKRFDVVTWKRMRADKHGVVTLDGRTRGNGAVRCGPSDAWTGNPAGPTRSGRCPRPSNRPVGPAATGVALLAARLAEGVDRVEYDDGRPGLGEYDIAFATKDEEGAE